MRRLVCLALRVISMALALTHLLAPVCRADGSSPSAPQSAPLSCGARLVTVPETEGSTLVLNLFIREEPADTPVQEAIRQMTNAAIFYGTVHLSYDAVLDSVNKIGAITTKQTPDYLLITCVTSPSQYRSAVYLLCEAIKNALLEPDALERARVALIQLARDRKGDPFLAAYDSVCKAVQARYAPNEVQLRHVTQTEALAYYKSHFVAARTVFSAAGKFDPAALHRSLDNNLFDYDRPGGPVKHPIAPVVDSQVTAKPLITDKPAGTVSYAVVAAKTAAITSPDYPACVVLATLLGGGHASRMFKEIRDKAGIGYSVGTALRAEDGDPLTAYVEWESAAEASRKPSTAASVAARIEAQFDSLCAKDAVISDAELDRARNFASGQYLLRHERIQERAFLPGWYETMGLGCTYDTELPEKLRSVTRDELLQVARKYLQTRQSLLVSTGK